MAGPAWMYTPDGFDQWFYHGYFLHLKHHIVTFTGSYYGSRLAWILPGYAAHALFGPLTANFLLRLYVCWVATISLYFLIQRSYGRRCAVICSLLLSASADFLMAAGWDYVDGAGIAYGLLCVEEFAAAASSARRSAGLRATFAGMAFAAAVHANVFLMILGPVLAVVFFARAGKQGFLLVLWALAGFAALTAGLGLVNVALGGPFLFFTPSLSAATVVVKANPYFANLPVWAMQAWWLVVPCAVTLASLLFLIRMAARIGSGDESRPRQIVRMADASSLPLLLLIFVGLTAARVPALQLSYYASYLLIFVPLSVGALIGRRLDSWSSSGFVVLTSASACLAVLVGAEVPSHLPRAIAVTYIFVRALPHVSTVVLAATLAASIVLGDVIRQRLVSTLVVAVVAGAVLIHLGSIRLPEAVGGALSRATYLDVDRTTRELGRLTHEGSLWFWYAYKPNGDQHYTSFCSTYLWATTLLGRALPDVTDLRYDPLHAGTYVAVMDDRESAVNQGIALLRDHGATLEPVDRLRSSVRPNGFGIALLRVTRLELAPKVYTLSPSRDTVRPVAELLNYDLDGLLTHTGHAVYGKELAPPPGLPRGVFKVTDMKDHFGTNFQPISVQGSPPVTAVEVTAIDQATDDRFGSINMIFQDQDYRTLYSTGTLPRGEDRTLVALPAGTRTIRVAFLANDLGFIKFPKAVQLRAFANK